MRRQTKPLCVSFHLYFTLINGTCHSHSILSFNFVFMLVNFVFMLVSTANPCTSCVFFLATNTSTCIICPLYDTTTIPQPLFSLNNMDLFNSNNDNSNVRLLNIWRKLTSRMACSPMTASYSPTATCSSCSRLSLATLQPCAAWSA